ncbi:MAG: phosphate regulon transcriptional regulator PhoB [Gammaproteobacteria bacterium]|nr:phosphate regulon transcriptional regulator PhoB [Gammaproteobacteria bacterium]
MREDSLVSAPTIMLVEDDEAIRELLRFVLQQNNFDIAEFVDAETAIKGLEKKHPSLILMDWMLPGMNGVQLTEKLKSSSFSRSIPIILLTARGEEEDKVRAFDCGADDYVTKPFSPRELIARIRAVIRRAVPHEGDDPIEVDGLLLNPILHAVTVRGDTLELGPTEFRLLHFFMTHQDRVYSRNQLLDWVWGANAFIEERTVDVYIRRLRAALEKHSYGGLIKTVRGVGYQFVGTNRR